MSDEAVPPAIKAEIDALIVSALALARPRVQDRRRFAASLSAIWQHGANYGVRDLAARLGVDLPDDRDAA